MGTPANVKYIVVGIDGTGSSSWRHADGSNSHIYQFVRDFHYGARGIDKQFFDGPSDSVWGRESEAILQKALDFIMHRLTTLFPQIKNGNIHPLDMFDVNSCMQSSQQTSFQTMDGYSYLSTSNMRLPVQVNAQMLAHQPFTPNQVQIVLAGHSRGGLVATNLARMLSPVIKVYFLALYDAVDRQPCLDGAVVENVKYVFHARRHPDVGSRGMFSNTSTQYKSDYHEERFFYTSHGGIGGSYVTSRAELSTFGDDSCIIQPDTRTISDGMGNVVTVDNINPLTKRFHKPIDQICSEGSDEADKFIREGARRFGLPIS
ncbi:hypothetical protein SAMN05421788_104458 [Filimonas lacunae]|uniref:Lipase (Class 3) n=1 Tax=Filimonas lacunae TaxID=477680 RepID=A0A173MR93_9BACT|nr:hypothetical protein [Filimonas lacunae]BAV10172.1 hypothetical protein FLA_6232 [Filimonas lacunae]SIT18627.1 hypothetical protein SAMN05421788_104458 [Filimonas lacunae]